ncbi:MAG: 4Fe-4S dicluster domain-containing protein [Candidatus Oleimicrobiaceae bacterium]
MKVGQKYTIDKQAFLTVLDSLRRDAKLIGPTSGPDGDVVFREIASVKELTFDYVNEFDPVKRFLIPHRQDLFRFELGKRPTFEALVDTSPQILFGIRSCDVKGILHWDKFFSGAYLDNYYLEKRANTTIISVACNRPLETCFCICCDGGPWLETGFDLQLTDFGDRYLVDVGSAKGIAILTKAKKALQDVTRQDLELRKELMAKCDSQMVPTAYVAKAIIQITNNRVREGLWDEMGFECFSCGGCTHVCPICTCYDVADYMESATCGVRFRCWDSCQYSGFTREASGHNPREKTKERIKRRFYHKLSYAYVKLDGHHGCVGCGRCITVCEAIGLLDLPAVVKRLRRQGQPEPEQMGA